MFFSFNKILFVNSIRMTIQMLVLLLLVNPALVFASFEKEYEVKAAFIIKMVSFITWPGNSPATVNSEKLNFCIEGKGSSLEQTRSLLLSDGALQKYFNVLSSEDLSQCNIVFFSKMPHKNFLHSLEKSKAEKPTLTFSDNPGYAQQGVMINFYTEHQKVGFEINWAEMKAQGFEISSRVLKLARIINGE